MAKSNVKSSLLASTTPAPMTVAQACEIAFEAGKNYAGQDGMLTEAFVTFKANDKAIGDMVQALTEGYYVRKMGYDRVEARRVIGLKKYNHMNPKNNSDDNRTFEQERVMGAVRTLVSRAKRLAGITKPENQDAEVARAAAEAERKNHEQRLIKADEIVNPKDDVDVFDAFNRLVSTMSAMQKKYAAKLVGDRGSAWRDWLAAAPR
jgi:hypothetical protein